MKLEDLVGKVGMGFMSTSRAYYGHKISTLAREEVIVAAHLLSVTAEELTPERRDDLKERVKDRYVDRKLLSQKRRRLRERMWTSFCEPSIAVRNDEAWRWLDSFLEGKHVFMLFDKVTAESGFSFLNGADIVLVLGESVGFEFYLTDESVSFLLCYQRSNYLIALGGAVGWLESLLQEKNLAPWPF